MTWGQDLCYLSVGFEFELVGMRSYTPISQIRLKGVGVHEIPLNQSIPKRPITQYREESLPSSHLKSPLWPQQKYFNFWFSKYMYTTLAWQITSVFWLKKIRLLFIYAELWVFQSNYVLRITYLEKRQVWLDIR